MARNTSRSSSLVKLEMPRNHDRLRAAGFAPVSVFQTGLQATINAFKEARAQWL